MRRMTRGILVTMVSSTAVAFGGLAAHADDCTRYISGQSSEITINQSCVEQLGLIPMFVQERTEGGYDVLVTTPDGTSWDDLAAAAREWLADAANQIDVSSEIAFVSEQAVSAPIVVSGGISAIEYVNYELSGWLDVSGASEDIRSLAVSYNLNTGSCSSIPVCTSCQNYVCGTIGPWSYCNCHLPGQSCCVIGF